MKNIEIYQDLRRIFPSTMDRAYSLSKEHRHVNDIMTTIVHYISCDNSMKHAAKIMGERHIGSLVVLKKDDPVGIITERDLLTKVVAKGKNPAKVNTEEVMSSPLITLARETTIKAAAQTMEIRRKTRLVIEENNKIVGIVTASDLVKSMPEVPQTLQTVDNFMTPKVVTIRSEISALEAAKLMGEKRIGSLIATKNGEAHGIFTERDLLTKFYATEKSLNTMISKDCSRPIIATVPGTMVTNAAYAMASKGIRRILVVRDTKLVGIVTARDLVKAYAH